MEGTGRSVGPSAPFTPLVAQLERTLRTNDLTVTTTHVVDVARSTLVIGDTWGRQGSATYR